MEGVMNHKRAKKMFFQYFSGKLSGIEKKDFEAHVSQCRDCKIELEEFKEIISKIKKRPSVSMDEKFFERTKYLVYKKIRERERTQEKLSLFLVLPLIISFVTFFISNLLFWQILTKIFNVFSPFIFCILLTYQVSGIAFFFVSLIIKFEGGLENGKNFL